MKPNPANIAADAIAARAASAASGPNAHDLIVRSAPIVRSVRTGPNVSCAKRPNSLVTMHLLPGVKTVRVPSGSPIRAANVRTNAAIISVPSRASSPPTANPLPGPLRISAPRSVPPRDPANVSASAGGFAENVPAFLRKPARPAKVGSE